MAKRVLVAYVSECGSTAEVAEVIVAELRNAGVITDVASVERARPAEYDAVVLGTCIRMGKPPGEAVKFAAQVRDKPVAVFSLGIQMREDTPENRAKAESFLASLVKAIGTPVSIAVFGGKLEHAKLPWLWRKMAQADKSGQMREGDWRDWDAIRLWAHRLPAELGVN